jgi:glucose/arabinose dehydrogenase
MIDDWRGQSVALLLFVCPAAVLAQPAPLTKVLVSDAFDQPVFVTAPAGDARLFVVDQPGRIWIVKDGERLATPFLDLRDRVTFRGEQGLLGLAFHPDYATNGRFYVNYTDTSGDTQVVRYEVSGNADVADAGSASTVLGIDQPAINHNGGWLGFGPDGYLYIAMGDGGGGGDTFGNGQNLDTLLGKILRIAVDGEEPYGIPRTNPFAEGGGRPEILLYGLRNPWRVAFAGNNLYIADVGQGAWDEISVVGLDQGGANLGWPIMEGTHCFRAASCDRQDLVLPVHEYAHDGGACSITGGFVYRGAAIPALSGEYLFSDYCAGFVHSFRYEGAPVSQVTDWTPPLGDVGNVTSFGEDSAGELYITAEDGRVFRIIPG